MCYALHHRATGDRSCADRREKKTKLNQTKTTFLCADNMLFTMSMSQVWKNGDRHSAYIFTERWKKLVCILASGALMHISISFNCHDTAIQVSIFRKKKREKTRSKCACFFQLNFSLWVCPTDIFHLKDNVNVLFYTDAPRHTKNICVKLWNCIGITHIYLQ